MATAWWKASAYKTKKKGSLWCSELSDMIWLSCQLEDDGDAFFIRLGNWEKGEIVVRTNFSDSNICENIVFLTVSMPRK